MIALERNPVEQRMAILKHLWLEQSDCNARIFLWEVEDDAKSLIYAFTALQQRESDYELPDLFITFRAPFDTLFGYSRALRHELLESYQNSREALAQQQLATEWYTPPLAECDSVDGFMAALSSFAHYYQAQFRYLVVVLSPDTVSLHSSWQQWIELALQSAWPANLRFMLLHSHSNPCWRPLEKAWPHDVQKLTPDLQQHTLIKEIASRSTEDNETFLYRRYMSDSMVLLQHGTAQQVTDRAQRALELAQQKGWPEQQVVMHSIIAGAWLKAQDIPKAVQAYRLAADRAARIEQPAIKYQLITQSLFGEAGAWFTARRYEQAAEVYARAAVEAQHIPHPLYATEGYRMAGFCYQRSGHTTLATKFYTEAVRAATQLPLAERKFSSLGITLHALLTMQDKARAEALEKKAQVYCNQLTDIQRKAEKEALALGKYPAPEKTAQLQQRMEQAMEQAFLHCCQQREKLIRQASIPFQRIIFAGRELLTPNWSGSPDIAHPLDKEPAEWDAPLSFMVPEPKSTEQLLQAEVSTSG
ncbi:hypothetical protein [Mixta intestinalis]|uniref:MalT-like TPR region domain-containing protein n=1 Tax=Mixta intestinalis TaxID=1615494 RepID=A0A6P1Q4N6_9GAMM|nr:hypothetical protein [Mixta intestinalis]QHM73342.1 hypothetical protein C7M51_03689 [Mixta intestinalis]